MLGWRNRRADAAANDRRQPLNGQRNPLYEYHKEALRSYNAMRHDLYHRITRHLLMSTIDINKKGEKQIYFV